MTVGQGTDGVLDQETLDILGPGEFLMRDYENASQPQPWINLYIAYFPTQEAGDTIHSPEHCLPGAGWIPTSRSVIQLTRPDGSSIPVNRYLVSKSGQRLLVLYWFQAHGRVVASEWRAKYYLISDAIHMNRSDGGIWMRLLTPMLDGESPDAAQARIMKAWVAVYPSARQLHSTLILCRDGACPSPLDLRRGKPRLCGKVPFVPATREGESPRIYDSASAQTPGAKAQRVPSPPGNFSPTDSLAWVPRQSMKIDSESSGFERMLRMLRDQAGHHSREDVTRASGGHAGISGGVHPDGGAIGRCDRSCD